MRRYDFEVVAQAMNDAKPRASTTPLSEIDGRFNQWKACCVSLANSFEQQTPAFERERFLKNCGVTPSSPVKKVMALQPVAADEVAQREARIDPLGNAGRAWTPEMDRDLLAAFDSGMSITEIAAKCRRTVFGTRTRLERHGRLEATTPSPGVKIS